MCTRPVVQGNPVLVTLSGADPAFAVIDWAIRPVVSGMLRLTNFGLGVPGVIVVTPAFAPNTARPPGSCPTRRARHEALTPPNAGCLHGNMIPTGPNQSRSGVTAFIRIWSAPPNWAIVLE